MTSPFGAGVKPVTPFPSPSAPVTGSIPPFPSATTAPPPMATPFMPRTSVTSAPPLRVQFLLHRLKEPPLYPRCRLQLERLVRHE